MVECAGLEIRYTVHTVSRVRIPISPPNSRTFEVRKSQQQCWLFCFLPPASLSQWRGIIDQTSLARDPPSQHQRSSSSHESEAQTSLLQPQNRVEAETPDASRQEDSNCRQPRVRARMRRSRIFRQHQRLGRTQSSIVRVPRQQRKLRASPFSGWREPTRTPDRTETRLRSWTSLATCHSKRIVKSVRSGVQAQVAGSDEEMKPNGDFFPDRAVHTSGAG